MELQMRIGLGQFSELTEEKILFAKELGIKDLLFNTPALPGEKQWEFKDLLQLRMACEDAGVRLAAIENVPQRFYDKVMLGLPGCEEQMEHMAATIRNIGKAGIPIFGYCWMPNGVWRTSRTTPGRGGAKVTGFDMELAKDAPLTHGRIYTDDEMWANYEYFMRGIVPVAEEAGVKLALHPDDPPVASLGGIARIFRNFAGFKRAIETVDSPVNGLDFCHGCWSEMRGGAGVLEAIEHFGSQGRIFYMHLRDVRGTAEKFTECFINEGNGNPFAVVRKLKEVGFNGFIIDDHVPLMVNDSPWGHRSRAYATGYTIGLIDAVNQL